MNRALVCLLALFEFTHCRSSKHGMVENSSIAPATVPASGTSAVQAGSGGTSAEAITTPSAPVFPADWCERLGATDSEKLLTVLAIISGYSMAQLMNCQTAALTAPLTDDQSEAWSTYLTDYTYLMAGCIPNFDTVEGGITVFGPANTPFVGAARARLSQQEVSLLVDNYVTAFTAALNLSASERDAVRMYLLQTASDELDGNTAGSLSTCESPNAGTSPLDAGSP
jgi:hypothetical protein